MEASDDLAWGCERSMIALRLISEGNTNELVRRLEKSLPLYAKSFSGELSNHPGAQYFLWEIRDYYQNLGKPVPAEIEDCFKDLPKEKPLISRLYEFGP